MPDKKYDILVFIGRLQPFHAGHKRVVDHALTLTENLLILIGSANRTRSLRNPFTYQEREEMVRSCYSIDENKRIIIRPLNDVMYNDDRWIEQVQNTVQKELLNIINFGHPHIHLHGLADARIGLIGCEKDHTSYYLKLFPTWGNEGVPFLNPINATDIRDELFDPKDQLDIAKHLPGQVINYLGKFCRTDTFSELVREHKFIQDYKKGVHQYPRIEHTVDAVVVQSGHVLLIRRRAEPGRGMWALPGGFIGPDEKLVDAMIRELREETKISVPEPVLRGSIVKTKSFDDPHRSSRGRIITQAYLLRLQDQLKLPKIKGSDDADKAKWMPLCDLKANELYEDHYFIVNDLIGEL